ncbi:MAG: DUF4139 domain-containing protein [candidate division Zixibacteria bacterium]|nr:DUF4139 domain-containing protein [candidate division Zixibacteria bacterium]
MKVDNMGQVRRDGASKIILGAMVMFALTVSISAADDMAVTVYNDNLGVISETRSLVFKKGINQLAFRDVPSQIDASSVRFDVIGNNRNIGILEQNYAYDLISPEQMYARYLDQPIELIDKEGKRYAGTLLAYSGTAVTLQLESGAVQIVLLANISEVNFPQLPDGLITRPTLFWRYSSDADATVDSRVSYQTSGLSWTAEYVGVLDKTDKNLDLSGWSSINNFSGKTYKDATLKLVAGEINRIRDQVIPYGQRMEVMSMKSDAAQGFQEKSFFEYHLYTLPRRATVADKEIKQISLFEPASTGVNKIYLYRPQMNATDVLVSVEFVNSKQSGVGIPLPAGRVRMFKADDDGSLILLGEDRLEHTPNNEKVRVAIGNAFDIKAEERQMNNRQITQKITEQDWEIEIRNRKTEAVTVVVEKALYGFWEVTKSSHDYKKKNATTLTFDVPVPADSVVTVTLTTRFTYQ